MDFIVKLLFLGGKYISQAAGRTIIEIYHRSKEFGRHMSVQYEKASEIIKPYDNMLELLHDRAKETSEDDKHIADLNEKLKRQLEEHLKEMPKIKSEQINKLVKNDSLRKNERGKTIGDEHDDAVTSMENSFVTGDFEYDKMYSDLCKDLSNVSVGQLKFGSSLGQDARNIAFKTSDLNKTNIDETFQNFTESNDETQAVVLDDLEKKINDANLEIFDFNTEKNGDTEREIRDFSLEYLRKMQKVDGGNPLSSLYGNDATYMKYLVQQSPSNSYFNANAISDDAAQTSGMFSSSKEQSRSMKVQETQGSRSNLQDADEIIRKNNKNIIRGLNREIESRMGLLNENKEHFKRFERRLHDSIIKNKIKQIACDVEVRSSLLAANVNQYNKFENNLEKKLKRNINKMVIKRTLSLGKMANSKNDLIEDMKTFIDLLKINEREFQKLERKVTQRLLRRGLDDASYMKMNYKEINKPICKSCLSNVDREEIREREKILEINKKVFDKFEKDMRNVVILEKNSGLDKQSKLISEGLAKYQVETQNLFSDNVYGDDRTKSIGMNWQGAKDNVYRQVSKCNAPNVNKEDIRQRTKILEANAKAFETFEKNIKKLISSEANLPVSRPLTSTGDSGGSRKRNENRKKSLHKNIVENRDGELDAEKVIKNLNEVLDKSTIFKPRKSGGRKSKKVNDSKKIGSNITDFVKIKKVDVKKDDNKSIPRYTSPAKKESDTGPKIGGIRMMNEKLEDPKDQSRNNTKEKCIRKKLDASTQAGNRNNNSEKNANSKGGHNSKDGHEGDQSKPAYLTSLKQVNKSLTEYKGKNIKSAVVVADDRSLGERRNKHLVETGDKQKRVSVLEQGDEKRRANTATTKDDLNTKEASKKRKNSIDPPQTVVGVKDSDSKGTRQEDTNKTTIVAVDHQSFQDWKSKHVMKVEGKQNNVFMDKQEGKALQNHKPNTKEHAKTRNTSIQTPQGFAGVEDDTQHFDGKDVCKEKGIKTTIVAVDHQSFQDWKSKHVLKAEEKQNNVLMDKQEGEVLKNHQRNAKEDAKTKNMSRQTPQSFVGVENDTQPFDGKAKGIKTASMAVDDQFSNGRKNKHVVRANQKQISVLAVEQEERASSPNVKEESKKISTQPPQNVVGVKKLKEKPDSETTQGFHIGRIPRFGQRKENSENVINKIVEENEEISLESERKQIRKKRSFSASENLLSTQNNSDVKKDPPINQNISNCKEVPLENRSPTFKTSRFEDEPPEISLNKKKFPAPDEINQAQSRSEPIKNNGPNEGRFKSQSTGCLDDFHSNFRSPERKNKGKTYDKSTNPLRNDLAKKTARFDRHQFDSDYRLKASAFKLKPSKIPSFFGNKKVDENADKDDVHPDDEGSSPKSYPKSGRNENVSNVMRVVAAMRDSEAKRRSEMFGNKIVKFDKPTIAQTNLSNVESTGSANEISGVNKDELDKKITTKLAKMVEESKKFTDANQAKIINASHHILRVLEDIDKEMKSPKDALKLVQGSNRATSCFPKESKGNEDNEETDPVDKAESRNCSKSSKEILRSKSKRKMKRARDTESPIDAGVEVDDYDLLASMPKKSDKSIGIKNIQAEEKNRTKFNSILRKMGNPSRSSTEKETTKECETQEGDTKKSVGNHKFYDQSLSPKGGSGTVPKNYDSERNKVEATKTRNQEDAKMQSEYISEGGNPNFEMKGGSERHERKRKEAIESHSEASRRTNDVFKVPKNRMRFQDVYNAIHESKKAVKDAAVTKSSKEITIKSSNQMGSCSENVETKQLEPMDNYNQKKFDSKKIVAGGDSLNKPLRQSEGGSEETKSKQDSQSLDETSQRTINTGFYDESNTKILKYLYEQKTLNNFGKISAKISANFLKKLNESKGYFDREKLPESQTTFTSTNIQSFTNRNKYEQKEDTPTTNPHPKDGQSKPESGIVKDGDGGRSGDASNFGKFRLRKIIAFVPEDVPAYESLRNAYEKNTGNKECFDVSELKSPSQKEANKLIEEGHPKGVGNLPSTKPEGDPSKTVSKVEGEEVSGVRMRRKFSFIPLPQSSLDEIHRFRNCDGKGSKEDDGWSKKEDAKSLMPSKENRREMEVEGVDDNRQNIENKTQASTESSCGNTKEFPQKNADSDEAMKIVTQGNQIRNQNVFTRWANRNEKIQTRSETQEEKPPNVEVSRPIRPISRTQDEEITNIEGIKPVKTISPSPRRIREEKLLAIEVSKSVQAKSQKQNENIQNVEVTKPIGTISQTQEGKFPSTEATKPLPQKQAQEIPTVEISNQSQTITDSPKVQKEFMEDNPIYTFHANTGKATRKTKTPLINEPMSQKRAQEIPAVEVSKQAQTITDSPKVQKEFIEDNPIYTFHANTGIARRKTKTPLIKEPMSQKQAQEIPVAEVSKQAQTITDSPKVEKEFMEDNPVYTFHANTGKATRKTKTPLINEPMSQKRAQEIPVAEVSKQAQTITDSPKVQKEFMEDNPVYTFHVNTGKSTRKTKTPLINEPMSQKQAQEIPAVGVSKQAQTITDSSKSQKEFMEDNPVYTFHANTGKATRKTKTPLINEPMSQKQAQEIPAVGVSKQAQTITDSSKSQKEFMEDNPIYTFHANTGKATRNRKTRLINEPPLKDVPVYGSIDGTTPKETIPSNIAVTREETSNIQGNPEENPIPNDKPQHNIFTSLRHAKFSFIPLKKAKYIPPDEVDYLKADLEKGLVRKDKLPVQIMEMPSKRSGENPNLTNQNINTRSNIPPKLVEFSPRSSTEKSPVDSNQGKTSHQLDGEAKHQQVLVQDAMKIDKEIDPTRRTEDLNRTRVQMLLEELRREVSKHEKTNSMLGITPLKENPICTDKNLTCTHELDGQQNLGGENQNPTITTIDGTKSDSFVKDGPKRRKISFRDTQFSFIPLKKVDYHDPEDRIRIEAEAKAEPELEFKEKDEDEVTKKDHDLFPEGMSPLLRYFMRKKIAAKRISEDAEDCDSAHQDQQNSSEAQKEVFTDPAEISEPKPEQNIYTKYPFLLKYKNNNKYKNKIPRGAFEWKMKFIQQAKAKRFASANEYPDVSKSVSQSSSLKFSTFQGNVYDDTSIVNPSSIPVPKYSHLLKKMVFQDEVPMHNPQLPQQRVFDDKESRIIRESKQFSFKMKEINNSVNKPVRVTFLNDYK